MLNISKKIYGAWNTHTPDGLPEAEIVPAGITSEKKKITSMQKKFKTFNEYDNVPLPGFTLFKSDRKRHGSADPTWLIIDPRGFLARITNQNLQDILHVTGITEGLIQEKCIWARKDLQSTLTLIPISSDSYIHATENTELLDNQVKLKDVNIGDTVLLQSGDTGKYMGVQSLYGTLYDGKIQVYPKRQVLQIKSGHYYFMSNLKILKVTEETDTPISRDDAINEVKADIATGNAYLTNILGHAPPYSSASHVIVHASSTAITNVPMSLVEITKDEAEEIYVEAKKTHDPGRLMLRNSRGFNIIDFPYGISPTPAAVDSSFSVQEVIWNESTPHIIKPTEGSYVFRIRTGPKVTLDDFSGFYKIIKHIGNETYI